MRRLMRSSDVTSEWVAGSAQWRSSSASRHDAGLAELLDGADDRLGDAAGQLVRRLQGVRRPIDAESIETRPEPRT